MESNARKSMKNPKKPFPHFFKTLSQRINCPQKLLKEENCQMLSLQPLDFHFTPNQSKGLILFVHRLLLLISPRGIDTHRICSSKCDFCTQKCENINDNCIVIGHHRMYLRTIFNIQTEWIIKLCYLKYFCRENLFQNVFCFF